MDKIKSWIENHQIWAAFIILFLVLLSTIVIYGIYLLFWKVVPSINSGFIEYKTTTITETNPATTQTITTEIHPGKTLWDWLELLFIPVVLAVSALLFNSAQQRREQSLNLNQQRESVLQVYLEKIGELMVDKKQHQSMFTEGSPLQTYVQVLTTTALRSLDKNRRNILCQFIRDAKLGEFILRKASLEGCNLQGTSLRSLNLSEAILSKADLRRAILDETDLTKAILESTNLSKAFMNRTNLTQADLGKSNLSGAMLNEACLFDANLCGANLTNSYLYLTNLHRALMIGTKLTNAKLIFDDLSESQLGGKNPYMVEPDSVYFAQADLTETDLRYSNLSKAGISNNQLKQAKSLSGAIMPDGSVHL